jgi:hypothetical protein
MNSSVIARYVTPWRYRREQIALRLNALRKRDGDNCRRCKRPLRFDFPDGHDLGPRVEAIRPLLDGGSEALENLCLTHGRCNAKRGCDTAHVKDRARLKHEAELFAKSRSRRRA